MLCWYPVYGHPRGPAGEPWYVVADGLVFRAEGHPDGPSEHACFRIADDFVYPSEHHRSGASVEPAFCISGHFVYPPEGPSGAPWYQVRDTASARAR